MAKQRVDNYAAGFIRAGASAVIAEAWASPNYMVKAILGGDESVEAAWRTPRARSATSLAFKSARSSGYIAQMQTETATSGFGRSIVLKGGGIALERRRCSRCAQGSPAARSRSSRPCRRSKETGLTLGGADISGLPTAGKAGMLLVPYKAEGRRSHRPACRRASAGTSSRRAAPGAPAAPGLRTGCDDRPRSMRPRPFRPRQTRHRALRPRARPRPRSREQPALPITRPRSTPPRRPATPGEDAAATDAAPAASATDTKPAADTNAAAKKTTTAKPAHQEADRRREESGGRGREEGLTCGRLRHGRCRDLRDKARREAVGGPTLRRATRRRRPRPARERRRRRQARPGQVRSKEHGDRGHAAGRPRPVPLDDHAARFGRRRLRRADAGDGPRLDDPRDRRVRRRGPRRSHRESDGRCIGRRCRSASPTSARSRGDSPVCLASIPTPPTMP